MLSFLRGDSDGIAFGMEAEAFAMMEALLEKFGVDIGEDGLRDSDVPEHKALTVLIESMGIPDSYQLCEAIRYVLLDPEPMDIASGTQGETYFDGTGTIFKSLDADGCASFRKWARDNYIIGDAYPADIWHPITVDEIQKMNFEAFGEDGDTVKADADNYNTEDDNGDWTPVRKTEYGNWVKRLGQHHLYIINGEPETLCGMPMLGNNYYEHFESKDLKPCEECRDTQTS